MAKESKNDAGEDVTSTDTKIKKETKKKGVLSRLWNALFRTRGDDFEKRLEHISKEEAAILSRIARRAYSSQRRTRNLIIFSLLSEVSAIGYAIMSTRSLDLDWKTRAMRVLPMFLLPALCVFVYSALKSFTKLRDQKDYKTLEKLKAERQAKIDELKERTNYYITQQLIQRYDPDPAAKAAAATVLASKLGSDSGLKVHLGDYTNLNAPTGKSSSVELSSTSELRNRKQSHRKTSTNESGLITEHEETMPAEAESEFAETSYQQQLVVEHHPQTSASLNDGGWIARLAAMLVGEDPTQSYALICGNCRMHNGLVRKEDFPYVTYYCPHCKALNRPKQPPDNHVDDKEVAPSLVGFGDNAVVSSGGSTVGDKGDSTVAATSGVSEN
ncbi:uncharacterized protein At2g24330-like [Andrographis paniculata]|uniref:uncharacterized protein At2g24330-like n=1 Tax=Andrographis paniculata TaxID=175694 RepID=UPI0021E6EE48|nr:uncharacterized protein At2g24330-like [Andrographis paniculata]